MSLWFFRRPRKGPRQVWLIDLPLLPVFFIAMVFLSVVRLHPMPAAIGSIGAMLLGYALMVKAKASLFRRGVWVSWGTRLMQLPALRGCIGRGTDSLRSVP